MSRNFTSDNVTPASAEILAALQAANNDCAPSYGGDRHSLRLAELANAVFERDVAIFPVASGTAANALALAQIAPAYGGIYCHETAHVTTDECAAPEFFTGGAKLLGLPAADGKVRPGLLREALVHALDMGVHHVKPAALSVTQATEWGTVYRTGEIAELAAVAREHGLRVHMDGARFANALAHLGGTAATATWRAGVDVLCLGATKNGALCAEAVIFFDPGLAADFARRRKQSGHLWSKLRFLSAQLVAYLENDLWLNNARRANTAAAALAAGLRDVPGARVLRAVDANEVFVALPAPQIEALETAGFGFYRWPVQGAAPDVAIRLVTSYATRDEDVAVLLRALQRAAGRQGDPAGRPGDLLGGR